MNIISNNKRIVLYTSLTIFFVFLFINIYLGFLFILNSNFRGMIESPVANQLNSGHPFTRAIYYLSRFDKPKSNKVAIVVPNDFASNDQQALLLFWASYWLYPKIPILYLSTNNAVDNHEENILIYGRSEIDSLQAYTIKQLPYNSYLASKSNE